MAIVGKLALRQGLLDHPVVFCRTGRTQSEYHANLRAYRFGQRDLSFLRKNERSIRLLLLISGRSRSHCYSRFVTRVGNSDIRLFDKEDRLGFLGIFERGVFNNIYGDTGRE